LVAIVIAVASIAVVGHRHIPSLIPTATTSLSIVVVAFVILV
jgi:hypothetical protein